MKRKSGETEWVYFTLALGLILVDQVLKFWVRLYRPDLDFGVFSLHLVTNTGATFGLFKGANALFIWLSLIVLGAILYLWDAIAEKNKLPFTLILGGVVGNLVDRFFLGHVVDFIDVKVWPVFNVADACISLGVLGLIWMEYKKVK